MTAFPRTITLLAVIFISLIDALPSRKPNYSYIPYKLGPFTHSEDSQILNLCIELPSKNIWTAISRVIHRKPRSIKYRYFSHLESDIKTNCTTTTPIPYSPQEDEAILNVLHRARRELKWPYWDELAVRFERSISSINYRSKKLEAMANENERLIDEIDTEFWKALFDDGKFGVDDSGLDAVDEENYKLLHFLVMDGNESH